MATAQDLIDDARLRLLDTDDEAYGDTELLQFLNDGINIFTATTGIMQTYHEYTAGGSNNYEDLSDLTYTKVNIYGAECNGTKLNFAPRYEADRWGTSAGTPTGWSVWGDYIYFDTTPTAALTLKVWYTYVPDEASATTSTITLPTEWHSAIVAYMVYRVRDMNREGTLADRAFLEFENIRKSAAKINEALMSGGYS